MTRSGQSSDHQGPDVDRVKAHALSEPDHGLLLLWASAVANLLAIRPVPMIATFTAWP